jgi:Protein of unknown function (DUF1592)/Protein of unknown function (DUF1588)/Protein of unknown function (DUF1585)/Protein of unknown function (DUF1595)/Protein of unknown function (DUF1587)
MKQILGVLGVGTLSLFVGGSLELAQRGPTTASVSSTMPVDAQNALVAQYCATCHNDKTRSGGMTLTSLNLAHPDQNPELAEKVIRKLRAGMMPPPGAKRPDIETSRAFATALENAIDKVAALHPNPGWRSFQRLSQAEYARSIHDLLGIDVDVSTFLPPDSLHDGFDNIAEAQSFSPAVLEGYMRASSAIVVEALGDSNASPTSATYSLSSTTNQLRHVDGAPMGTRGGVSVVHNFPADGEYVFTVKFQAATNGGLIGRRSTNEQVEVSINGERAAVLDINPNMSETNGGLSLRTGRISVKAGPQRVSAAFIPKFSGLVDDLVAPIEYTLADAIGAPQLLQVPHLQDFTMTGPYTVAGVSDTPARRRIFKCRPLAPSEELPCATSIITSLARQAYRRPVTQEDLEGLLSFYQTGRKNADFEAGIRTALQAILASPKFVFRLEPRPVNIAAGQTYRINDLELASRMSYFLWSTAPDDELINSAAAGKLHNPSELEKQTRRMLADSRSESLATRFAAQWLRLAELKNMIPDALLFPNFDHTLADAMRRETELLFDSVVREDRSLLELLTANYTFVNERLALHYKIPGILGNRFRRVELTEDNRRGLLGQGSVLTLTSQADRTSPVLRGKWVMEVLLGTPPPAPPPNVPSLEATKPVKDGHVLTVRERMEAHRSNPACNSCHRMIDPIGLSLENFDPTGTWRIRDSGVLIDPSTVLFDGTPANGPAELRKTILKYPEAFIRNFTENLLTYALGRRLQYSDMPNVRAITREAARSNNRVSSLILGIIKSAPFQMSRAEANIAQK